MLESKKIGELKREHEKELKVLKNKNDKLQEAVSKQKTQINLLIKEVKELTVIKAKNESKIEELEAQLKPQTDEELEEASKAWEKRIR